MNSHLSKTEYRIMEYFWSTGGKYTFGELMKYFNEEEDKNWKKQIALFLISQNLSMFGSSVVGFSIVWYITVTTESGFWITLSTLATLIPQVLVSLWAGVYRLSGLRRRL